MLITLLSVLPLLLVLLLESPVLGQEARLREIQWEKKYQQERFERATLEQRDAQARFRDLIAEEAKLRADLKKKQEEKKDGSDGK